MNVFLVTPLSVTSNIIISIEKRKGVNLGFIQAVKKVYTTSGVKGFYKGLFISLILVINPVINFTIHSFLKVLIEKSGRNKDLSIFLSGAFSKLCATIATFPFTTIKTNQQGKMKKKGILETILFIFFSYGGRGFYKGLSSKLFYTILNTAIMFLLYDKIRREIRRRIREKYLKKQKKDN